MIGIFSLLSKFYLQIGETIQKDITGVGEKSVESVKKSQEFSDIPGYTEEKQIIVNENQINEQFDPINDALDGLREGSEWLFDMIVDFFASLF